jgi:hypothetical protein
VKQDVANQQMQLFADYNDPKKTDTTSTFADNLSLPVHRWFRYSAGFSALWVRELIGREKSNRRVRLLDPFAGSGTALLEAELSGVEAIGVEAHPFVARIARTKLYWRESPETFIQHAMSILALAKEDTSEVTEYPELIKRCFPNETLVRLDALHKAWVLLADNSPISELCWLALASILRKCSPVGTAQWQYVLPNKTKVNVVDPYQAFEDKVRMMCEDIRNRQSLRVEGKSVLYTDDARHGTSLPNHWADLIITSPPYANNYDYADATRLELTFFGDIRGWGDLQESVRKYLIRACTQHVSKLSKETDTMLREPLLTPIQAEIAEVCHRLEIERDEHAGKKPYHTMIAAYFLDMAHVWQTLRQKTNEDVLICFVIGDSAPYGIYVPVAEWLGELAMAAGFRSYNFEKTRDRNVKWKNRKHRVPLYEGRLWVRG